MDIRSLLLSSELDVIDGMSLQNPDRLKSWFTLGDRISLRNQEEVFDATVTINDRLIDIVAKTNLDEKCLLYEYLVGLEVNKLTQIPNFIETYAFFLIENTGPANAGASPCGDLSDPKGQLTTTEEEGEPPLQYGQYIPFLLIEKVAENVSVMLFIIFRKTIFPL